MRVVRGSKGWALCLLLASAYLSPVMATGDSARVIAVGGGVTELVYALGQGHRLSAVDSSSVYPPETKSLPRVGYYRDLSVEGVLSLQPEVLIASDQSGPPSSLQRLRDLGVQVVTVPDAPTVPALLQRIAIIAEVLGAEAPGQQLADRIQGALANLPPLADEAQPPKVLSIMAHGRGVMVAGSDTAADAILRLTGFENVMAGQSGYKPASPEAVVAAQPNCIITTQLSIDAQGGRERFLALPELAALPAARAGRLVVMDDLLYLSFGPRVDEAVMRLREIGTDTCRAT